MVSRKIVMIAKNQGYLSMSLKDKFSETGYEVEMISAEVDAISRIPKENVVLFLYCDSDFVQEAQVLNFIKDKAAEEDIPVFVAGDADEISQVRAMIPKHLITEEFVRPINVNDVLKKMDQHIKTTSDARKKKVLVVDDSGAMLRNVKGWLEDKYQVILANSGAMAIKYLTMSRPDLVLLDYEMPVVDGRQVLEMIRTENDFSDIPVIFLTSKGDRESVMQVMSLKPEGYLLKTMPPAQIVQEVDNFFEKQKAKL